MTEVLAVRESQELSVFIDRAKDYIADSMADNTKRCYESDFRQFSIWCSDRNTVSLPASPAVIASYLAYMADSGKKASTIDRARAAIRMAHDTARYDDPTDSVEVRRTLKGIRRNIGTARTKKAPVLTNDIQAMLNTLPSGTIGVRDKALLLVGFAGGFRRSEIVGITVECIEHTAEGIRILLTRSKTDQEGQGQYVGIKRSDNPSTCPVRALNDWLETSGIKSGPVFRRVDRHSNVSTPMTSQSVALIVKRAAESAGLDAAKYSGHSLRAGLVTQAALSGATETNIMRQTRHKKTDTVREYVRIANIFKDNVSGILGL